jgi:hypothetical protein
MSEDNSKLLEIFHLTWPNLPRTKKVKPKDEKDEEKK